MSPGQLTFTGVGVFLVVGAAVSMYGPLLPRLQAEFGLAPAAAGAVVSLHFAGGCVGIVLWALAEARGWARPALVTSIGAIAVGGLLIALPSHWSAVLAGGAALGLGYGGVVLGINRSFALGFGARGGAMLNLVNALYGFAAILGPLAVGAVGESWQRLLPGLCGVLALVVLPPALAGPMLSPVPAPTPPPPPPSEPAASAPSDHGGRRPRLPLGTAAVFMVLFLLYVSVETGAGAWIATYLSERGYPEAAAAAWTAAFWAGLSAGRLIAIPLSVRVSPPALVLASVLVVVIGLAGAAVPGVEPLAFGLAGLGCAAVFPGSFGWLTRAFPGAGTIGALAIGAGMGGGVLGPAVVGRAVAAVGPEAVPWALLALAGAALACVAWLARRTRALLG